MDRKLKHTGLPPQFVPPVQRQTYLGNLFCRKCGYPLKALSSENCPECGRPFNLSDPRTFTRKRPRPRVRRGARVAIGVLVSAALLLGLGLFWLWWGWHREQPVLANLKAVNASIVLEPIADDWTDGLFGKFIGSMSDRISEIELENKSLSQINSIDFSELQHARKLTITLCTPDDLSYARIAEMGSVKHLNLTGVSISSASLARLAKMSQLQRLVLWGVKLDQDGMKQVSVFKQLRALCLAQTGISDDDLRYVQPLSNLEELYIGNNRLTDRALQHLAGLTSLRILEVDQTHITADGAADLKKHLPNVSIRVFEGELPKSPRPK